MGCHVQDALAGPAIFPLTCNNTTNLPRRFIILKSLLGKDFKDALGAPILLEACCLESTPEAEVSTCSSTEIERTGHERYFLAMPAVA